MYRRSILSILVGALLLAACAAPAPQAPPAEVATQSPLVQVRLPMGYIPSVQFAPFYVAEEKGYFRDAGLEVEFDYSFETDGVSLVGANNLQFALVSGEQVLLARAQGLPVVYVMGWWQDYPVAWRPRWRAISARLRTWRVRRSVCLACLGPATLGCGPCLNAGGVAESDVTLDSIGFNQVEALVTDQDQAVVVYANNEPIQLRAQGFEVDVIRVADYVHLASNGLIPTKPPWRRTRSWCARMVAGDSARGGRYPGQTRRGF